MKAVRNLRRREIDLPKDRNALLEFHCLVNQACDSAAERRVPYERYRTKWLSTGQPAAFLADLKRSRRDKRTIALIWETPDQRIVAYVWVTFTDVPEYDFTFAEMRDLAVARGYRRRGIATQILRYVRAMARKQGANALRSETGAGNKASQKLHESVGLKPSRLGYELRFRGSARSP